MKKNIKYLCILLAAFFFSISSCFAIEMTLDELGEKIEGKSASYYAYVIGHYAFPGDHVLTMQDVMLAARTIDVTDQTGWSNEDDVYNEMTVAKIQAIYDDEDDEKIIGWEVKNNLVGTSALNANSVDVDYIVTKNGNYKIEAGQPAIVKHTVSFIVDDEEHDSQEIEDGETAEDPDELFGIAGYKFVGWFTEPEFENEYDFDTPVTSDISLYGKYVPTININEIIGTRLNGFAPDEYRGGMENHAIVYTIQDNDATLDKVSYDGINELITNDTIEKIVITSDDLENDYEITKGDNVAATTASVVVKMTSLFEEYTGLTADEITFDDLIGLNLNIKFELIDEALSENDANYEEYTAQIFGTKIPVYTVTFNDNGTNVEQKVKKDKKASAIESENAPEGKELVGWFTDQDLNDEYDFDTPVTSSFTLYGKYAYNPLNITTEAGLIAMLADSTVDTIGLGADIALGSQLSITRPVTINGNNKTLSYSGTTEGGNLIAANLTGELNLNDLTIDGNKKVRDFIIKGGTANLTGVTVQNGRASSYADGIYATNSSVINLTDCTSVGNRYDVSDSEDYYVKYATDLWIGANATGTIVNSTIGNAIVNGNEYSATNPGDLTMVSGTIDNLWVEYDQYGAKFNYTAGTINNLMVSTKTAGEFVNPPLVPNTSYIGGEIPSYTVTYHYNDGTEDKTSTATVALGEDVTPLDLYSLIPDDKIVEGWYTEEGLNTKYTFEEELTSDLDLYANIVDKCTVFVNYVVDGNAGAGDEYPIACGTTFNFESDELYTSEELTTKFDKTTVINSDTDLFTPASMAYINAIIVPKLATMGNNELYTVSRDLNVIKFTMINEEALVANTSGTGLVATIRDVLKNENVENIVITVGEGDDKQTFTFDNAGMIENTNVSYVAQQMPEVITAMTGKPINQVTQGDLIGKSVQLSVNLENPVSLDEEGQVNYDVNFIGTN